MHSVFFKVQMHIHFRIYGIEADGVGYLPDKTLVDRARRTVYFFHVKSIASLHRKVNDSELTTSFIQGKIRREGFLCFLKDLNYSVLNRLRIARA